MQSAEYLHPIGMGTEQAAGKDLETRISRYLLFAALEHQHVVWLQCHAPLEPTASE